MSTRQIQGSKFVTMRSAITPHLPLNGSIDLTYRCNNSCRHCWLHQPDTRKVRERELSFQEWVAIIDQARAMGTHTWAISGGEPMLREDFSDLLDYITSKASSYSLNTNGALITPAIARRLSPGDTSLSPFMAPTRRSMITSPATPEVLSKHSRGWPICAKPAFVILFK